MIYTQAETNLHTHSFYCGHGVGTPIEYAQFANLSLLGFTEHCPTPDNRWASTRMAYHQMSLYEEDVRTIEQEGLTVLLGYECDYLSEYHTYYEELKERVDYLIFGVHDLATKKGEEDSMFYRRLTKKDLYAYTDLYIQGLESKLFLFGAHPDLFGFHYRSWDSEAIACSKAIIECAISNDIGLEINGNGMRKGLVEADGQARYPYPIDHFWHLASTYPALKVIASSDAHRPSDVTANIDECMNLAETAGITLASYQMKEGITLVQLHTGSNV